MIVILILLTLLIHAICAALLYGFFVSREVRFDAYVWAILVIVPVPAFVCIVGWHALQWISYIGNLYGTKTNPNKFPRRL